VKKAFTLVEVLIGIALVVIIFFGIFSAFYSTFKILGLQQRKTTALEIAQGEIEKIRNMKYPDVGTLVATPPYATGTLENLTSTTSNGVVYNIERKVKYIYDPSNEDATCTIDYKKVEIKVSFSGFLKGEVFLTTEVTPRDKVEEAAECKKQPVGVLSVKVFNTKGEFVQSPKIEIYNPTTNTTTLIDSVTPTSGKYDFVLSPGSYRVIVSKEGYSTERTYATEEIAIPAKPNPIVLQSQITEISFLIDRLSSMLVKTLSTWGEGFFSDTFDDESKISEKSNVAVSGGEVNLSKIPGVYFTGGTTDGDLCSFPGINGDCGQSFTMGSQSKEISQVQLYIRKTTTDVSDIYLEIRSQSTIGPVLAQSYTLSANDIPGSLSWITFTLQNPVTLSANTQYFLRLRSIPDSTNPWAGAKGAIYWGYIHSASSPPAYQGGDAWRYIGRNLNPSDPGQQLGPADQYDFSFKISDDEYVPSGYLISTAITPTNLLSWDAFSFSDSEPANTDLKYQIYYASGTNWILIPDSDLPGNSTGFDSSPVNLKNLSTTTYSKLKLKANFSTNSTSSTPSLDSWQVSWKTSNPTPIPNVTFDLRGDKIIGKDSNENPVYKFSTTTQTNSQGQISLSNLEWDVYYFSNFKKDSQDLDLVTSTPPHPVSLDPGTNLEVSLYLDSQNSLLTTVKDSETLKPIFSATTTLAAPSFSETQYTDINGQTIFIPLNQGNYNLSVEAVGYAASSTSVSVSGKSTITIFLSPTD